MPASPTGARRVARGLGEFEHLILLALLELEEERAYGVPIRDAIERRTGRRISAGAIYTALDRLAARGLVSSRLGEPTAERGGRRKRLYRLEPAGAHALTQSVQLLMDMSRGLLHRLDLRPAAGGTGWPEGER
jgi:PadR family transcriptional regulator, regulatory protein PadR